ncbi:PREDICTED: cystatin-like [Pygoscelis adeliae]|uniref:cystatin-like n=1 Tax=Pygoscelis adeliae TaxID=9238 RepID=UPI0004F4EE4E|nr:PREDICTED: cystatin-like [Pygoscelis adeliae]
MAVQDFEAMWMISSRAFLFHLIQAFPSIINLKWPNMCWVQARVVRIISTKRQIVSGIKYIMKVEIGRTTCPKPATDLQSCAFHDAPQMAKHTICDFVVYTIPWLNQIKLLDSSCQ